ncbi:isoprenylcysteine carboxylmethyltransferase family protein [Mangrovibacter phragmitis]|uniref:methyltransferase family protein n=1 Tax=Mangrovibacter phragmitis TaxID=1691903 RepID=UPI00336A7DBA
MRNVLTRLRVWFPPPLILLLFFVTDMLTAIPRFTFDIVNMGLSVLLTCVCITMILHTVWQMRMKRTTLNPLHADRTTTLVTGGCYAWSRNPIYLGMSGLQLALALCFGSLVEIFAVPLFMFVVARLHIDIEEKQLRKRFGVEWECYMQRVRRWL